MSIHVGAEPKKPSNEMVLNGLSWILFIGLGLLTEAVYLQFHWRGLLWFWGALLVYAGDRGLKNVR